MTLSLAGTGCRTTAPTVSIPDMSLVRPTRPQLAGSYEDMVRDLIRYGYEMEAYCEGLELYIQTVGDILST